MIEETLRSAGRRPGRRVSTDHWRTTLEKTGLVRMHDATEAFLAEFGGLDVQIRRLRDHLRQDPPFNFDPDNLTGEEDRFADRSHTIGRAVFPLGELDEGGFFLGIDENSEIYLVETWLATFGDAQDALEKLAATALVPPWRPETLIGPGELRPRSSSGGRHRALGEVPQMEFLLGRGGDPLRGVPGRPTRLREGPRP